MAICRPDLSLPLAIPLGRFPISVVLERVARESFLRRPDERVAAHIGGGYPHRPLLRFVRAPPGPRRRSDPPTGFVVHQLASTFESSPISSSGVHSGGSRIAIRALQMWTSSETTTSKELRRRFHHSWVSCNTVQISLLSPLRGFGSWMAPNPGAHAPGYTLAPLRGYGGPLHPAPKGRSRKAWGVSPR